MLETIHQNLEVLRDIIQDFGPFSAMTLILFTAILLITIGAECGFCATVACGVELALLLITGAVTFAGIGSLLSVVYNEPVKFLVILGLYFVLSPGWALIKWLLFLRRVKKHIKPEGRSTVRPGLWHGEIPPRVANYKADIIRWMVWSPISIITTLIDVVLHDLIIAIKDLLGNVFTRIYAQMSDLMQRISNNMFAVEAAEEETKRKQKEKEWQDSGQ